MSRRPRHLDLHTGIGGFTLAARWSGYETVAHAEIEPYCNELLTARFPSIPNYGDVTRFCRRAHDCIVSPYDDDDGNPDTEPYCPRCEDYFGDCECIGTDQFLDEHDQPDVITSGFPCQDLSFNGKGAGLSGSRSSLWSETSRITDELQPTFVILENVAALTTRGLDIIAEDLEGKGYALGTVVVPALLVGASHQRERVYAVGHLTGERMEGVRPERIQEPHPLAQSLLPLRSSDGQWEVEPDFRRSDDGLSPALHRSSRKNPRLAALGNAIVPQIAAAIFDLLPDLARILHQQHLDSRKRLLSPANFS